MSVRKPFVPVVPARILLVDNNASGLRARQTVLEESGYRISTASSGEDALEQFSRQQPDLVITDFKMGRLDGRDLIARLRKKAPEVPVILISGYADALGLNEENTGADAVIQKSAHEVSHLVRTVARLLRQKPKRKPASSEPPPKAKWKTV